MGYNALATNTVGDRNVAIGEGALQTHNPSSTCRYLQRSRWAMMQVML